MITIIIYPRLNISVGNGLPHFGLMHVLATNLIIWMRTVIKESIHEYHEAEEKNEDHDHSDEDIYSDDVEDNVHEELATHILHKRYSEQRLHLRGGNPHPHER